MALNHQMGSPLICINRGVDLIHTRWYIYIISDIRLDFYLSTLFLIFPPSVTWHIRRGALHLPTYASSHWPRLQHLLHVHVTYIFRPLFPLFSLIPILFVVLVSMQLTFSSLVLPAILWFNPQFVHTPQKNSSIMLAKQPTCQHHAPKRNQNDR